MARSVEECDGLIDRATERDLVLMPGHTFLYSPPVIATKGAPRERARSESSTSARRAGSTSGIHQRDVSVVRDLAPHDFSILLYWLGRPSFLRGIARDTIVPGTFDVAFIDVGYDEGALVHLELSWLAPTKLRRTVLVGSEKMIVYEDTSAGTRRRAQDQGAARRGRPRRAVLRDVQPRQPRDPPERRQRRAGPRSARLLDAPLLARRAAVRPRGRARLGRLGPARRGLHRHGPAGRRARAHGALVARPDEAAPDGPRRQREDDRLRGHERRAGARVRPRRRADRAPELRRVPALLPLGRHPQPAAGRRRAAGRRAAGLHRRRPERRGAALEHASSACRWCR